MPEKPPARQYFRLNIVVCAQSRLDQYKAMNPTWGTEVIVCNRAHEETTMKIRNQSSDHRLHFVFSEINASFKVLLSVRTKSFGPVACSLLCLPVRRTF